MSTDLIPCSFCEPSVRLSGQCSQTGCDAFRVAESLVFAVASIFILGSYINLGFRKHRYNSYPQIILLFLFFGAVLRFIRPLILLGTQTPNYSKGFLFVIGLMFSFPLGLWAMAFTIMAQRWGFIYWKIIVLGELITNNSRAIIAKRIFIIVTAAVGLIYTFLRIGESFLADNSLAVSDTYIAVVILIICTALLFLARVFEKFVMQKISENSPKHTEKVKKLNVFVTLASVVLLVAVAAAIIFAVTNFLFSDYIYFIVRFPINRAMEIVGISSLTIAVNSGYLNLFSCKLSKSNSSGNSNHGLTSSKSTNQLMKISSSESNQKLPL